MQKEFFNIKNNNENNEKLDLKTEIITEKDWKNYKKIWLEAIKNEPLAYWVTKDYKTKIHQKTEEEWRNELKDSNFISIISSNNNIPIGTVQALSNKEKEDLWKIRRLYLNENFRRKGLGEKMMTLILDEIKKRKGKKVILNVVDTQKEAKEMYQKLDFKTYDTFPPEEIEGIEYPGGEWMEKEI